MDEYSKVLCLFRFLAAASYRHSTWLDLFCKYKNVFVKFMFINTFHVYHTMFPISGL